MKNLTVNEIMENKGLCEQFANAIFDSRQTEDEPMEKIGRQICEAYVGGDANGMLIAICGWSMDSLLERMAEY